MFKLFATRQYSTYEQSFMSWTDADIKSKFLASQGFIVTITRC